MVAERLAAVEREREREASKNRGSFGGRSLNNRIIVFQTQISKQAK